MADAVLEQAKADLRSLYGAAADKIRSQQQAAQAGYDQIIAQIQQNAAQRAPREAAIQQAENAGMTSAVNDLGIDPMAIPLNPSRAARHRSLNDAVAGAESSGWEKYLGTARDIEGDRIRGMGDLYGALGEREVSDLERRYADAIARYSGGGRGGSRGGSRGGGNYSGVEYPKVDTTPEIDPNYLRQQKANYMRYALPGATFQANGLIDQGGNQTAAGRAYAQKLAEGMRKAQAPKKTRRRGAGGTF